MTEEGDGAEEEVEEGAQEEKEGSEETAAEAGSKDELEKAWSKKKVRVVLVPVFFFSSDRSLFVCDAAGVVIAVATSRAPRWNF